MPDIKIIQAERIRNSENLMDRFSLNMLGYVDVMPEMHYFVFHVYFLVEVM